MAKSKLLVVTSCRQTPQSQKDNVNIIAVNKSTIHSLKLKGNKVDNTHRKVIPNLIIPCSLCNIHVMLYKTSRYIFIISTCLHFVLFIPIFVTFVYTYFCYICLHLFLLHLFIPIFVTFVCTCVPLVYGDESPVTWVLGEKRPCKSALHERRQILSKVYSYI